MSYVERLMGQDEDIMFVTRRHWLVLLPAILIDLAAVTVIVALSIGGFVFSPPFPLLALLLLLVPLGHFLARFTAWRNEQFVVTSRRVIEVRGVFSKYVSDSSLDMVNDVMMEQSALGRLLDYGDVRIITGSDIGANTFRRIAHPIRLKTAMLDQKASLAGYTGQATQKEAYVTAPELLAQLDDLRRRGVISEEEFEREKQQLLERL